jgi:hypothetical protein
MIVSMRLEEKLFCLKIVLPICLCLVAAMPRLGGLVVYFRAI